MTHYFFNRCKKDCLPKLEELADELKLKKIEEPPTIEWGGYSLKRKEKFDRNLLMAYNPERRYPLILQTSSEVSHKQKDIRIILQRLIRICKPTQIYDFGDIPYNMGDFK